MSLITRCTGCETLFKVVPDQLRISEGWVRCGQCGEIFDASLHLQQAWSDGATAVAPDEDVAANFEAMDGSGVTSQILDVDLDSAPLGGPDKMSVERAEVVPPALAAHAVNTDIDDAEPDRGVGWYGVSFLRGKKPDSFWHKRLMRATLGLLSLTLLLGLCGQIVLHERDRILASEPALKPWLLALCDAFNCTLSPLRRIEAIVIDSASFAKIRGDYYRLNVTLKNTAMTALAMPALELTLTDALDQPVVRRVFLPGELDVKSDTLAAGSERVASLAMTVKAGATADRVAGYRLLAFYP